MQTLLHSRAIFAGTFLIFAAVSFFVYRSSWSGDHDARETRVGQVDMLSLLEDSDREAFPPLSGEWRLDLPNDHGAHPDARMETWSLTANVRDESGRDLGIQFVMSRVGIVAESASAGGGSPWTLRDLYRGHVALVGLTDRATGSDERFRRGFRGVAGYDPRARELRLDDWSAVFDEHDGSIGLSASVGAAGVELRLTPIKPAVSAVPRAETVPFRGYSAPRMAVEGHIESAGERRAVSGLGWLDHVWGELPLPGGPVASDRLQLHLDDGSDLSVIRSRRRDGSGTPTVRGVLVTDDGTARRLDGDGLSMEPTRTWSGDDVSYPVEWRLDGSFLDLSVTPLADDQAQQFAEPIWSGAVVAEGRLHGEPVSGAGTLNLTGYAER